MIGVELRGGRGVGSGSDRSCFSALPIFGSAYISHDKTAISDSDDVDFKKFIHSFTSKMFDKEF